MAKTLLLQHKEAVDKIDVLAAQVASLQAELTAASELADARDKDLAASRVEVASLTEKVAAAEKRDADLCQELAVAQAEIVRLTEQSKTVDTAAAAKAAQITADIGVPPVTADTAAKQRTDSVEDLQEQYAELLKTDTRAAGVFYNDKLAPALRK